MTLEAKKIELARGILETDNEALIDQALILLDEDSDWYDDLPEHVKEGIERGLQDIKHNRTISHDEVMKKVKKKYL